MFTKPSNIDTMVVDNPQNSGGKQDMINMNSVYHRQSIMNEPTNNNIYTSMKYNANGNCRTETRCYEYGENLSPLTKFFNYLNINITKQRR